MRDKRKKKLVAKIAMTMAGKRPPTPVHRLGKSSIALGAIIMTARQDRVMRPVSTALTSRVGCRRLYCSARLLAMEYETVREMAPKVAAQSLAPKFFQVSPNSPSMAS